MRDTNLREMAAISTVCSTLFIAAIVAVILAKARKVLISSNWYKRFFAYDEAQFAEGTREIFAPVKEKLFSEMNKHLKTMTGDVLEIGIGAGENFDYYPHGTSLIAVDTNPHVEKLLKKSLEEVGGGIHLKKFVAASAEDMSCAGQIGVEDNSVAAAVCTLVLCSLTDDQTKKTLQELKRVLMPGGRFYFLEHVAGKQWTLQYLLQQLMSKSLIWPTMLNGCRCDRETLSLIEEAGFKMVQAEKMWVTCSPEMFTGGTFRSIWNSSVIMRVINSVLFGFAENGEYTTKTKEKKIL